MLVSALTYRLSRWRARVRSTHSDHLRIARGALRVSAFVLAGRCAGALKEMAIAYKYGVSNIVDAYQFTTTLVTWLPITLLGVMGAVLVPTFVSLRPRARVEQAQFVGEMEGAAAVAGMLFALALYIAWPVVVRAIGSDLPPLTREMCWQLMLWLAPTGVLILASGIYAGRLQSRERHINSLLEGLPATVILISVLVQPGRSLVPLILGTVVGHALQVVFLKTLATRVDGVSSRVRFSLNSPEWEPMWLSVRILMIGQIALCFCAPLDQYFAAHLGKNSSSILGYANRVLALLLSMGAMATAQAILPILSDILQRGDAQRARRTALLWALASLALGLAGVAVSWLLAPKMIAVLFQRGAFTAEDTVKVTAIFRWGLLQVPFYFALQVLSQLFASERRFRLTANIALFCFALKVAGNFVFVRHFGLAGVQISTALMYASAFLLSMGMLCGGGAMRRSGNAG
ncbi:MAG: putative peptidoglycan lipid flippase [Paraburkholderia sp.]|nr:putative peptidoglycan lipid flippase [Paraburkholderia sp.]